MPQNDRETDLSEMRNGVDPVQSQVPEELSEMQEPFVGYTQKDPEAEAVRYRVMMADHGCSKHSDDLLFLDYFSDYEVATTLFDSLCDDTDFIKHYDSECVEVVLQMAFRGLGQVFWETIRKSVVYDDKKE